MFLDEFTQIVKIFDFDESTYIIDDMVFQGDRILVATIYRVQALQGDVWSFTGANPEAKLSNEGHYLMEFDPDSNQDVEHVFSTDAYKDEFLITSILSSKL